jgi:outer membrane protein assembly factor BamD (BamD/ComL family)
VTNRNRKRLWRCGLLLSVSLAAANGCTWNAWSLLPAPQAPPGAADSLVLRGDQLEAENPGVAVPPQLTGARELFRQGDYEKARKLFAYVADNTKNSTQVAEEARYYEAECLRLQEYYPSAADKYAKLLADFPSGVYREQAVQRMFDIANYWLEDTRTEMEQAREKTEGKRWFTDQHFVNWNKTKPLLDEQGRALEKLEQVQYNDIAGQQGLADKALYLMGMVAFYNGDYREADHHFSALVERYDKSPFTPQAIELDVIAKNLATGGSDYDGKLSADARKLIHKALQGYPELAAQKGEFLERQLIGITLQQAEKDYKIGEFYQRTGHPESAYFYYEIVRRRYPGTKYFDMATERMYELRGKVEKLQQAAGPVVPPAPGPAAPPPGPLQPGMPLQELPGVPETAPVPRPLPGGM